MIIPGLPLVVTKKSYSPVEGFETYPLNSSPSKFFWFVDGNGYYRITNVLPCVGLQSLELNSTYIPDSNNQVGINIISITSSNNLFISKIKIKFNYTNNDSWSLLGISDNNTFIVYWWIMPDGLFTNFVNPCGTLMSGIWSDIIIITDLTNNNVTVIIDESSTSSEIKSIWGDYTGLSANNLKIGTVGQPIFLDQIILHPY